MYLTLIPAYGRDYKSKADVMRDWHDGKDFIVSNLFHAFDGKPINKSDVERLLPGYTLHIRYKKLTQICVVK